MERETWLAPARCRECGSYPQLLTKGRRFKRYCVICGTGTKWQNTPKEARLVWNLMQGVIDT